MFFFSFQLCLGPQRPAACSLGRGGGAARGGAGAGRMGCDGRLEEGCYREDAGGSGVEKQDTRQDPRELSKKVVSEKRETAART